MYAWRARDVLGLPEETVGLIADRISRCARGPFFRFPSVRLNQINWNCELYAHDATVTGDTELLVGDYRAQVERFARASGGAQTPRGSPEPRPGLPVPLPPRRDARGTRTTWTAPNTRARPATSSCTTRPRCGRACSLLAPRVHDAAARVDRAHRLRLLDPRRLPQLGHRLRLQALARRAHLGARAAGTAGDRDLAALPQRPGPRRLGEVTCSTAACSCSSGSRSRRADGQGIAPANLYDVDVQPLGLSIREMFAARMQANAARAIALGLADCRARSRRRSTRSTATSAASRSPRRSYNTAVLAVNQHAVPYGGIELAPALRRRPARGRERRRPAAGELRRAGAQRLREGDPASRSERATQLPSPSAGRAARVPARSSGPGEALPAAALRQARSRRSSRAVAPILEAAVETRPPLQASHIETRWTVTRRRRGRLTVDVLFPSWGKRARSRRSWSTGGG